MKEEDVVSELVPLVKGEIGLAACGNSRLLRWALAEAVAVPQKWHRRRQGLVTPVPVTSVVVPLLMLLSLVLLLKLVR